MIGSSTLAVEDLRELELSELDEVSGGFLPIGVAWAIGAGIGLVGVAVTLVAGQNAYNSGYSNGYNDNRLR